MQSISEWAKVRGRITWLAKRFGVSRQYVHQMLTGVRPMPEWRASAIRRAMKERERAERILE